MNALTRAIREGREAEVLQPYARVNSSAGGVLHDAQTGAQWAWGANRRWRGRRRTRSRRWT